MITSFVIRKSGGVMVKDFAHRSEGVGFKSFYLDLICFLGSEGV